MSGFVGAHRLQNQGKVKAAQTARMAIPKGKVVSDRAITKFAKGLEANLFQLGGRDTVERVLVKLLSRPALLEAQGRLAKVASNEAEAVAAAVEFLGMLNTGGRRTAVNANAFMAVLSALLPKNVFENRKGRAFMRMFNVNYRTLKKGCQIAAVTASEGCWRLIMNGLHSNGLLWRHVRAWWHSSEASVEDNDNKQKVRVYREGAEVNADGTIPYEEHFRRYFVDSMRASIKTFRGSGEFGLMAKDHAEKGQAWRRAKAVTIVKKEARDGGAGGAAVDMEGKVGAAMEALTQIHRRKVAARLATRALEKAGSMDPPTDAQVEAKLDGVPDYPALVVSLKQFRAAVCPCISKRKGTECDCKLCSWVKHNIPRWHRARQTWRSDPGSSEAKCVVEGCLCRNKAWQHASRSPHDMTEYQLCRFLPHAEVNGPLPSAAGGGGGVARAHEEEEVMVVVEEKEEEDEEARGDEPGARDPATSSDSEDDGGATSATRRNLGVARVGALAGTMVAPAVAAALTGPVVTPALADVAAADVAEAADAGAAEAAGASARRARNIAKAAADVAAKAAAADEADDEYSRRMSSSPLWLTSKDAKQLFRCRSPACFKGTCRRWCRVESAWVRPCGWGAKRGPPCAVENSEVDMFTWMRWEMRLRGKSRKTGLPVYAPEFVPYRGTRAEFMVEMAEMHTEWMPHTDAVRLDRQMIKLIEERLLVAKDESVMLTRTDYASVFQTQRMFNATCAAKECHNMCVSVAGYKPKAEQRVVRKRGGGSGERKVVDVVTQTTDVFFGLFGGSEGSGHKPSAQHYNMQREDQIMLCKEGYSAHGEWFENGVRLPRHPGGTADEASTHLHDLPPAGTSMPKDGKVGQGAAWTLRDALEPTPLFPTLRDDLGITDGCSSQVRARVPGGLLTGPPAVFVSLLLLHA